MVTSKSGSRLLEGAMARKNISVIYGDKVVKFGVKT